MRANAAIFDIDGTLINGFAEWYFVKYLLKKGIISPAKLLPIIYWFAKSRMGISGSVKKVRMYSLELFRGWQERCLVELIAQFYNTEIKSKIFKAAKNLVCEQKTNGSVIVISSTMFDLLANEFARDLGADFVIATQMPINNGVVCGDLQEVNYGDAKLKRALLFSESRHVMITHVYANHSSDIPLLKLAENPIACNPDKILRKYAKQNNWAILDFIK